LWLWSHEFNSRQPPFVPEKLRRKKHLSEKQGVAGSTPASGIMKFAIDD
jgi:hypothetical protein